MSFYEDASWLLIPSGIEEDVVFAQKPISGLGDLTFTRASDATYTDSTGVVRRSPYNLLTWSEDFTNAAWSKLAAAVSSNVTTAPNGTLTADKLVEDSTTATHATFQITSILSGSNYNYSVYLKAAERFRFRIRFTGFSGAQDSNVDLNAGTASAGTLTNVGNGWFRLTWSVNSNTGAVATNVSISLQDASGNTNYLGNGTSGAFIWGAQLVEGSAALDYFPTTNRQDVPRIDFRNADGTLSSCGRLLLEPQRTNSIRNSSMVGAVAGSPGTLPANWSRGNGISGFTQTIVGIGTENGLPYVDLRYSGAAINTFGDVILEASNVIASANAATWTQSAYIKLIAAPNPPLSTRFAFRQYNSALTFLGVTIGSELSVSSSLTRYNTSFTTNQATVAFVQPSLFFNFTNGATYDFTIRIAAPQMELGGYATTWVPTTTAAVTRIVDAFIRDDLQTNGILSNTGLTWYTRFRKRIGSGADAFPRLEDAAGNNVIGFSTTANTLQSSVRTAGGSFVNTDILLSYNNQFVKACFTLSGTTLKVFVNGTLALTTTAPTSVNYTRLRSIALIEKDAALDESLIARTALSDAQCIQLTTL